MDALDRIENAAGALGYRYRRSRSLVTVDLSETRSIRFSRGGGRGLVTGRRVENGQIVAEVRLTPDRAVASLLETKARGEQHAD